MSRLLWSAAFAVVAATCAGGAPLPHWALVALCALAGLAELSDAIDGVVARRRGTAGVLGGVLDPLADSLGRLTIYFAMALAGWVSLAVPLVMTGRDILAAYVRIAHALTGGKTSARMSGKLKAIVQGGGVFVIVVLAWAARWLGADDLAALRGVAAGVIIAVTAWSCADYLRSAAGAVRSLHNRPPTAPGGRREDGAGRPRDTLRR